MVMDEGQRQNYAAYVRYNHYAGITHTSLGARLCKCKINVEKPNEVGNKSPFLLGIRVSLYLKISKSVKRPQNCP